jgi:hypothetical protein
LPSTWNRPFQPEIGIHASKMIFDTLVGLIVPRTWQIGTGSVPVNVPNTGVVVPGAVVPMIVVGPAGSVTAAVIVVSGNARDARLSQDVAATAGAPVAAAIASTRLRTRNLC